MTIPNNIYAQGWELWCIFQATRNDADFDAFVAYCRTQKIALYRFTTPNN